MSSRDGMFLWAERQRVYCRSALNSHTYVRLRFSREAAASKRTVTGPTGPLPGLKLKP